MSQLQPPQNFGFCTAYLTRRSTPDAVQVHAVNSALEIAMIRFFLSIFLFIPTYGFSEASTVTLKTKDLRISSTEVEHMPRKEFFAVQDQVKELKISGGDSKQLESLMSFMYSVKIYKIVSLLLDDAIQSQHPTNILSQLRANARAGIYDGSCISPRGLDCYLRDYAEFLTWSNGKSFEEEARQVAENLAYSAIREGERKITRWLISEKYLNFTGSKIGGPREPHLSKAQYDELLTLVKSGGSYSSQREVKEIQFKIDAFRKDAISLGASKGDIEISLLSTLHFYLNPSMW